MNSKNRRHEDSDFDSWDRPNQGGFVNKVKSGYRRWRENQRLIAEERQSLKEFQQSQAPRPAPTKKGGDAPTAFKSNAASSEADTGRMLKKSGDSNFQGKSWFQIWREERQLRKEYIRQQRQDQQQVDPLARRNAGPNKSAREFAVGNAGRSELSGQPPAMHWKLVRKIRAKVWELRIPQWLLGMTPAVIFLFFVVLPSYTELHNRYVAQTRSLEKTLPELIEQKKWQEASFIAYRVFDCSIADINDVFEYFQIQQELGHKREAWEYLQNQQNFVKTLEKGQYHLRFAEEILKSRPSNDVVTRVVVGQLKEALNNQLTDKETIKARQVLARIYSGMGDLVSAYKVLEPIQSKDVTIAADVLWIRFNLNRERSLFDPKSLAQQLMGEVDKLIQATDPLTDREIGSKVRLMMLVDKEPELRQWVAALPNVPEETKIKWSKEIDQMSLAGEFQKTPIQYDKLWGKLAPFLESDPNNLLWQQIAVNVWALPEKDRFNEGYQWVENKLKSDQPGDEFLKMTALSAHMTAQWDKARRIYEVILKHNSNDVSVLNNLAGVYYKFPPYDFDKALALSNRALELTPDNLGLLETKGQILARQGKLDEAQTILERCLVSFPDEWNLHNTLAQIYEAKGQSSRAKAHRDRMLNLKKPNNAPLQDSIVSNAASKTAVKK